MRRWSSAASRGPMTRFLYASRFFVRKGASMLIAAVNLAWERGARFELLACGDGPLWRDMRVLAAYRDGLIRVEPRPPTRGDYLWRMGWADCVLCPSLDESFGVVAFEAVARGKAVIATPVGAHPLLAGLGAVMIQPTPEALADALEHPPGPPSASAVDWVRTRFSARQIGEELADLACLR